MALTVSDETVVCRARCLLGFSGCSKKMRSVLPARGVAGYNEVVGIPSAGTTSPTGWGEIFRGNPFFHLQRAGVATAYVVVRSSSRGNN